jgi:tRNA threonylcarbamoyladenosine biosynthesis protein TsaB
MSILYVNSNDKNPFAAIRSEGSIIVSYAAEFAKGVSGKLPDKLVHCLHKLSNIYDFRNLNYLAVTVGPGSFTGIRVGLSLAKGIAFRSALKMIPINNFELTLNRLGSVNPAASYCIITEAKLPEYYFSVYDHGKNTVYGSDTLENIQKTLNNDTIIVGDFDDETQLKHCYFVHINVKDLKNELDSIVEIAETAISEGRLIFPEDAEPLYLKDFNFRKI